MPHAFLFRISLFILIYLSCSPVMGQNYKAAVGVRFGYGWGVTAKGLVAEKGHFVEGMIRYGYHGVVFTQPGVNFGALYEKHFGLGYSKNWCILLGAGPSLGIGKTGSVKVFTFGVGPLFGFDVMAKRLPFNFSLDYKPAFYVDKTIKVKNKQTSISYYEIGFSVRYAIIHK
jgi:hypothetical protein